jgi:subtilisin family serine protease
VEQDYWAAAVEFADSVGVDVINSSLGYYSFDDKSKNYQLRNLDGQFALISRQASKIADKGMILVCSAGNSGAGPWKKVTPPGDADNVLTVGAIDKDLNLAHFSSIGNTADGRIKPDVVAMGKESNIMGTNGCMRTANGTSFASPTMCGMVACLWQALPELTAKEIIELVRRSSDRAEYPDNIYGYGVPDMWKAYESAKR